MLSTMSSLRELNISDNYDITCAGLPDLAKLTNLTHLNIAKCRLGITFAEVSCISSLEKLDIGGNYPLISPGLSEISNLKNLRCLHMSRCFGQGRGVTVAIVRVLKQLSLVELDISGCKIDDGCLTAVSEITSLTSLNISHNTRFTQVGLRAISTLPLTQLVAASCDMKNPCLRIISKITTLRKLILSFNTDLSAACVHHLKKLADLEHLDVNYNYSIRIRDLACLTHVPYIEYYKPWLKVIMCSFMYVSVSSRVKSNY